MLALLAESDRLSSVVELVGLAALPARERIVMLTGRLLREGALEQSARARMTRTAAPPSSPRCSKWCSPCTTAASPWLEGGLPASAVEEFDLASVTRARDETGPDDAEGVNRLRDEVLERIGTP